MPHARFKFTACDMSTPVRVDTLESPPDGTSRVIAGNLHVWKVLETRNDGTTIGQWKLAD